MQLFISISKHIESQYPKAPTALVFNISSHKKAHYPSEVRFFLTATVPHSPDWVN